MLKLLIDGYTTEESRVLHSVLSKSYDCAILLSTKSQTKAIAQIIEENEQNFEGVGVTVCMFVEYKEKDINALLKSFPKSLKRPLFCILTDSNREWNLAYLGNHLIEERREMTEKMKQSQK